MKKIKIFILGNLKRITTFLLGVMPVFFIFLALNVAHAENATIGSSWNPSQDYLNVSDVLVSYSDISGGLNNCGTHPDPQYLSLFDGVNNHYWSGSDYYQVSDSCVNPIPGVSAVDFHFSAPINFYIGTGYTFQFRMYQESAGSGQVYPSGIITITNPITDAVSLYAPTSTIPDFARWSVSWVNAGSLPPGTMSVYYGLSTTTMNYHDDVDFSPYVSANPLPILKSHSLWFPPLAIPITWYAEAIDHGATSSVFSNIMTFSISPDAAAPPVSTDTALMAPFSGLGGGETSSTLASSTTNCGALFVSSSSFWSDPIGAISNGAANGICNAINFLFVPNSAEQADIAGSFNFEKTEVQNKPPFGYVAGVVSSFNSFSPATSTTSTPLLDTSGTSIFGTAFHALDVGLALILWFLFGWYIVHRAKQIEL